MISDRQILQHIERQPKASAGYKQLVKELGLRGNDRRELEVRLRQMIRHGELIEIGRDRYALPQAEKGESKNLVSGRLHMHRDGFGFVTPQNPALKEKLDGDIFIPPSAVGLAMHGDLVMVEIGKVGSDRRAEGRIVKIAGRAHSTIVGVFHYGGRFNFVKPMDEKISKDIIIPPGLELLGDVDGKAPESKHRVLGMEAKRRQWDDLEGVVVDVEITDWPSPSQPAKGKVIEILGYEDDFGVDVEIIIRKHHLPHFFPAEVLDQAQSIPNVIPHSELGSRHDYRDLPIVTIDGETARDFDDAVVARVLANGNYELQVHIADVAQYVPDGTPLDDEARLRGTSVYFPDRAVPMLPLELSTDICSLRPKVERLVLSCVMEIDRAGEIVGYDIHEGVIRSAERMTYTDVQSILDGDKAARAKYAPLVENFELMREVAETLNRKRVRRGSIDFDLPEPVIEFDEQGLMQGVTRSERKFAHRLIEEFMLSANECVASYLEGRGIASLYRIHEKPDAKKIYDFEVLAASFGYTLGVGSLPIKKMELRGDRRHHQGRGRNPQAVEVPQEVHITPRMYQKLTQKIAGQPEERILSYLMLRSLKQARYSEKNEGHFALAAPTYTHFTSPIRRYPDLIIHRILKEVVRAQELETGEPRPTLTGQAAHSEGASPWSKRQRGDDRHAGRRRSKHQQQIAEQHHEELGGPIPEHLLHDIAEESSQSERRADEAERELMEWKKIKFMRDRVGEEFDALIISITKFGFFVELTDMFIEGLVPLNSLVDDRYTFRENTRQIMGERTKKTYSMGDRVRVLLDRIDRMQRKLQFSVIEDLPVRLKAQMPSKKSDRRKKKEKKEKRDAKKEKGRRR
ncbi:MAG TPA: RNB domain-containing ribonuclease [Terriglobales bacterium]|nr:RNB domain-containing ribonuclease [Terriglobales bacterium]